MNRRNRTSVLALLFAIALATTSRGAVEVADGGKIPYNGFSKAVADLDTITVDGVKCVPLFVKLLDRNQVLDLKKIAFRVKTWEDKEHSLKSEAFSSLPSDESPELVKKMMKEGFTHQVWVPKSEEEFVDGQLVYDAPKDALIFASELGILQVKGIRVLIQSWEGDVEKVKIAPLKKAESRLSKEEVLKITDALAKKKGFDLKFYPDRDAQHFPSESRLNTKGRAYWSVYYERKPSRSEADFFAISVDEATRKTEYWGGLAP